MRPTLPPPSAGHGAEAVEDASASRVDPKLWKPRLGILQARDVACVRLLRPQARLGRFDNPEFTPEPSAQHVVRVLQRVHAWQSFIQLTTSLLHLPIPQPLVQRVCEYIWVTEDQEE